MRCESEASLTIKEHLVLAGATEQNHQALSIRGKGLNGLEVGRKGIMFAGNPIGGIEFINEEVKKKVETCAKRLDVIKEFASTIDEPASPHRGFYKYLSLGLIQLC